jgi:transcription initiation factor IIF auxiliary subunit
MIKSKSNRIAILEKQIKWIEKHYQYRHRHDNTSNNNDDGVFIKQLKQDDTHSN